MQDLINVNERLPEIGQLVVGYTDKGSVQLLTLRVIGQNKQAVWCTGQYALGKRHVVVEWYPIPPVRREVRPC